MAPFPAEESAGFLSHEAGVFGPVGGSLKSEQLGTPRGCARNSDAFTTQRRSGNTRAAGSQPGGPSNILVMPEMSIHPREWNPTWHVTARLARAGCEKAVMFEKHRRD